MRSIITLSTLLLLAALPADAGDAAVPKAVEAFRNLQVSEHLPARGDSGGASWSTGAYVYDPAGNVSAIGSQYFLYDTRGRLVGANVTAAAGSLRQNYSYDAYGNMTSTDMAGVVTPIATESSSNHLNGAGVQYDAAGNMIQGWSNGDSINYKYDSLNMLQQVTDTRGNNLAYLYTADDERIWSYDLGVNVSHWAIRDLGGKVLRDYVQDGVAWGVAKDYFYRDGLLLAAAAPSGVTEHFSLDHLGTPRLITDQNHNKIGFHIYFPFGNEWSGVGQQETPPETMRFTGHERDKDLTGNGDSLDYMHARYYSATIGGRFLSVDPVIATDATRNPQLWNRYAYARNNPMLYTDPDGKLGAPWHFVITLFAARAQGLSWRQSFQLSWQNVKVDFKPGSQSTNASDTNIHAMRGKVNGRDQTVDEARQGTAETVKTNIEKGTTEGTATALHTVQDQAAPLHDAHVWHGFHANAETVRHIFADLFPSLTTIRNAYSASREVLSAAQPKGPSEEERP
jgi:RHS repeat-associated protein